MYVTCKVCGNKLTETERSAGLCEACRWDRGFSVTTDWAEDVTIRMINEKLNNETCLTDEIWTLLMNMGPGFWSCTNCGENRFSSSDEPFVHEKKSNYQKSYHEYLTNIIEKLKRPCPQCNCSGFLRYFKSK